MNAWTPLILTVAPNGAYKQKADHPQVPLTAAEMAITAKRCLDAGAAMLHMHVRTPEGRHLLDAQAYLDATAAVRAAVGDELVVQITSESGKIYAPEEQIAVVRAVRPEAVSVGLREIVPDARYEAAAREFFSWLRREHVMTQVILYSDDDVRRWQDLRKRGVIEDGKDFLLFVLGRYAAGQLSDPRDLLPFLAVDDASKPFSLCAFGPKEYACVMAAATLGGHARVGFENNLYLADSSVAADNAALVKQAADGVRGLGRPLANAADVRAMFG